MPVPPLLSLHSRDARVSRYGFRAINGSVVIIIAVAILYEALIRSYAEYVALIPKGVLNSERTATFAVIASIVGLIVIPILTVPAMLIAGFGWRGAPRWTRVTLIAGAVLFAAYVLYAKPGSPHTAHG